MNDAPEGTVLARSPESGTTSSQVKELGLLWLLPVIICAYAAIASAYPYYALWDSTQICTLEAFLVGAGQLPDHLFHPNLVPLVLEQYAFLPLGKAFGWISASSITELRTSLNPYLPFVETAEYLLRVGYAEALVFLAFMYVHELLQTVRATVD